LINPANKKESIAYFNKKFVRQINRFVEYWNKLYYFDYFYRKEFKIPAFCKKHLKTDIRNILFWYKETLYYKEIENRNNPNYITDEQKESALNEAKRLIGNKKKG